MKEHAYEILEKIDKETDKEKQVSLLKEYGSKIPYSLILSLNFDDRIELDLPEGMPPYKRDEATNPDLFNTSLLFEIKRLGSLVKGRNNLPKIKREHIFIQILEAIPPKEADVLIFAKDKALNELYPNITYELVQSIFPNYCFKEA